MKNQHMKPSAKDRLLRRREFVADLYIRGWNQYKIADHLGVNQATISRDLVKVRKTWQDNMSESWETHVGRELAKVDAIEAAAWEAWERSRADKLTSKVKKTTKDGKIQEVIRHGQSGSGDPRFLAEARHCVERRCRILGLEQQQDNINSTHVDIVEIEVTNREDAHRILSVQEFEQMGGHIDLSTLDTEGLQTVAQEPAEDATKLPATQDGNGRHEGNGDGFPLPPGGPKRRKPQGGHGGSLSGESPSDSKLGGNGKP